MTIAGAEDGIELHPAGEAQTEVTPGGLTCTECGYAVAPLVHDSLPSCPACGGRSFRRASLFDQTTISTDVIEAAEREPVEISRLRERLAGTGPHLAWQDPDGDLETMRLETGWTRIGRSGSADIRLDHATVSRRHALVVLTPEGQLRALDDRSLNGLYVNGEHVEWAPLADGDELEIGSFRLFVII